MLDRIKIRKGKCIWGAVIYTKRGKPVESVQIAYDKFTIHFESNHNNIDSLVYF